MMNKLQLSFSSIKDFESLSPLEWKHKWIDRNFDNISSKAFTFGSLLDAVFFEPETINDRFVVFTDKMPSDAICEFMVEFLDILRSNEVKVLTIESHIDYLKDFLLRKNYWSSRKIETNLKNVVRDAAAYFDVAKDCGDKKIVPLSDVEKCYSMKQKVLDNPRLRKYLVPEEHTELFFQKTLKKETESLIIKAVYDCIFIDHKAKEIQVVDLKSTAQAKNFNVSVDKYRYGAQVGIYNYVLDSERRKDIKGYEIILPINIVADKTTGAISVHQYKAQSLDVERNGGFGIKGWQELIEEIQWHYENNFWDLPKQLVE